VPGFDRRHAVRPGLTGLAQLYGHADLRREKKLRYDLLYIQKRSLGLDLKLIGTSFVVTFLGQWERRGPKLTVGWGRGRVPSDAASAFEQCVETPRSLGTTQTDQRG
jgi:hypothetical protein